MTRCAPDPVDLLTACSLLKRNPDLTVALKPIVVTYHILTHTTTHQVEDGLAGPENDDALRIESRR